MKTDYIQLKVMQKVCILGLLLLSTMAIDIKVFSNQEKSIIQEAQQTKWGSIALSMVDIAAAAGGPLQELNQAIQDLFDEIHTNINNLQNDYTQFTNEFHKDSTRLEQQINDAQIDVSQAQNNLDNFLVPSHEQTEKQIDRATQLIAENRKTLDVETFQRNKAHSEFENRVQQHNQAISAIDESLGLLQGISGSGSLVQIRRLETSVDRIEAQIGQRETYAPLMINIVELVSKQKFTDQQSLQQLIALFNDLRVAIVDELNQNIVDEEEATSQFADRQGNLNAEYNEFQRQLHDKLYQKSSLESSIEETQETVATRSSDLEVFTEQLEEVKKWYAHETQVYQDLSRDYQEELEAAEKARGLLNNPDFSNYLKSSNIN